MTQKPPIPMPASLPLPWEAWQGVRHQWSIYAKDKTAPILVVVRQPDDTQQTVAARAKLFAAAPTMLLALESVFEWLMEVAEPDNLQGYYGKVGIVIQAMNAAKDYCESGECRGDGFPAFGDVLCSECRELYPDWERDRDAHLVRLKTTITEED